MRNVLGKCMGAALLFAVALSAQGAKYTFKVTNPLAGAKLTLQLNGNGEVKTVELTNGEGTIEWNGFTPQYATLRYGRPARTLYLDPAQDLTVSFDGKTLGRAVSFEGAGAAVNNYLNNTAFAALGYMDAQLPEAKFITKTDSVYKANLDKLDAAKMPAAFAKDEKIRLKYDSYGMFPVYQSYFRYFAKQPDFVPTDAYYQKLKSLMTFDGSLLVYPEYQNFITNAIMAMAFKNSRENAQPQDFINYVSAEVKDPKVASYVTDNYVTGRVSNSGVDGADALIDFYHKTVKDPELTKKFDALCASWQAIKAGNPSPTFSCPDINGKTVSLSDLKGKYVYIDVWATWCGPCRAEIPHLKKLEEAYKGKDIEFVSLSCDQDKAAWEQMVKAQALQGIQLYMGPRDEFMKKYIINGIPRFILLDREGKIVKADAPRPSNPETAKLFDELLKK